jgi:16S rRNA (adenine1518-N6/adenine1519-N6)-dimethyltransferase
MRLPLEAPPRRKLSQVHLVDEGVVERILREFGAASGECVVEVGPGTGVLSDYLAGQARRLVLCEVDPALAEALRRRFFRASRVELVEGDFLDLDLARLLEGETPGKTRLISNLPYHVTSAAVEKILGARTLLRDAMLMMQREVADRLLMRRASARGLPGLRVEFCAEARSVMRVPPSAYSPRPKVWSEVVHLRFRRTPPVSVRDEAFLWKAAAAGFRERRRTLRNNLRALAPEAALDAAWSALRLKPSLRAEEMSLADWASLSDTLCAGTEKS